MVGIMLVGFLLGPALAGLCSILFIPAYGWRVVLFFALLPLILIPFLWYFLPESVRFLVQKGRYEKAVTVLRRMEKAARIAPIEWTEESFVLPALERKASVKQLFTSKLAVMTVLVWLPYLLSSVGICSTTWLPTLLNKAGLSLIRSYGYTLVSNGGSIVGSVFLGMALDRFGRKEYIIVIYLAAARSSRGFSVLSQGFR